MSAAAARRMSRIIRSAIATAKRLEAVYKIIWEDQKNPQTKMLVIPDRDDSNEKKANHPRIPLSDISGYSAAKLIEEQRPLRRDADPRVFPCSPKSAGTAFQRAFAVRLRKPAHPRPASRLDQPLFENRHVIHEAVLVWGHKPWKMSRRYTHLAPESLHDIIAVAGGRRRTPRRAEKASTNGFRLGLSGSAWSSCAPG